MCHGSSIKLCYVKSGFMDFKVTRSFRRKTLQVRVGIRGVDVSAPAWVSDSEIGDFLLRQKSWIDRALAEAGLRHGSREGVFSSGGTLYVMGEAYQLTCLPLDEEQPCLEEFSCGWRVKADAEVRRRLIVKWYQLRAWKIFPQIVEAWAVRMGMSCPRILVKDQQRLWGSYSARTRSVQLNWRMLAFPPMIMDYIVVHELSHARHLDHSPLFWDEVSRFCPDWRARRRWLRTDARKYLF